MSGSWYRDMDKYFQVIDFGLKENADNYIQAGWEFIATRTSLIGDEVELRIYRVGWRHDAGEPVYPPKIEERPGSYPQDGGSSNN